ncbi:disease resistance protein RPM1-like [Trifolium medium]|uniref:Disease resistance protein RPM1-like n=1 Tax=Trifolium medium TaxID=97028 RepID=A0A392P1Z4_9FABA|nr:disease resistance protein RPM1-like [Trifolium medium]
MLRHLFSSSWIPKLENLVELSMSTEDPLESLHNLPNLLVFNLAVCSYEGALNSLKELTLMNIPNLKTAPSGIDYLESLEVLNIRFMPTEFEKSIGPLAKLVKQKKKVLRLQVQRSSDSPCGVSQ